MLNVFNVDPFVSGKRMPVGTCLHTNACSLSTATTNAERTICCMIGKGRVCYGKAITACVALLSGHAVSHMHFVAPSLTIICCPARMLCLLHCSFLSIISSDGGKTLSQFIRSAVGLLCHAGWQPAAQTVCPRCDRRVISLGFLVQFVVTAH